MSTRRNTMYNVAYRVFSILLPVITSPYLARVVGTHGVGTYTMAWSVSQVFVLIGTLGLSEYGVRTIARVRDDPHRLSRTFSEIYQMQLLVAGISLLAWFGYVFLFAGEEQFIAFHMTMMSVSCLCNVDWCLMGLDEFRPIALRNTAVKLVAAAAIFLFVRGPEQLWIYGFAWSLATLFGCLLCWPMLKGRIRFRPVPMKDSLKHLKPTLVLFISVICVRVYRTMDKIMLGAIAGMDPEGLYENAENIIYCLSGFISAVGTVMMPHVAHLRELGEDAKIRKNMDLTMQMILCLTSAMAFGITAVGKELAPLFYGEPFAESGVLMIPLAFTLILIGFANVVRTQWVLPQNRDRIYVSSVMSGALVNLVANSLLIPRLGAMGAAIGTVMAEFTVPLVQFIILRRELPYRRFLTYAAEYAAIGAVMLAAVRFVGAHVRYGWVGLGIQVAAGMLVYGLGCIALWKLTRNRAVIGRVKGTFQRKKS